MRKELIAIDFDGMLYSFKSGWTGSTDLPDPPTAGAIEWLLTLVAHQNLDVCIFSCRNESWRARRAIKKWLVKYGFPQEYLRLLSFPKRKPAGLLIDDRVICFDGKHFPTYVEIVSFKPWHGKGVWGDEQVKKEIT